MGLFIPSVIWQCIFTRICFLGGHFRSRGIHILRFPIAGPWLVGREAGTVREVAPFSFSILRGVDGDRLYVV